MPNPMIGTQRLPQAPQPPARPQYGPGNMPPLPPRPLTGVPKVAAPAPVALAHPPASVPAVLVTPPVLPPLPPTAPPAPSWMAARNPTAKIVQDQYVDLRLDELQANRNPQKLAALQTIEAYLLKKMDPGKKHKKIPRKELERIFDQVERNLQSADLTINFELHTWFKTENPYDTYTQMYQRNIVDGEVLLRGNSQNDPDRRASADNQVTFPEDWQGAKTPLQRGLSPGRQGADRIMAQMDTGPMVRQPVPGKVFKASNPHFNAHTKQIFLGLNYGRRPHGSAQNFGDSYFVVKPELKPRCLYYAMDTFQQLDKDTHAGHLQIPYADLGTILAPMHDNAALFVFHDAVMQSCYEGKIIGDESPNKWFDKDHNYLLEAHHFGAFRFREHVEYMVISPKAYTDPKSGYDPDLWPVMLANARKFADKHGFRLFQTN